MARKPERPPLKPKLTDAERHKSFVETAKEVDASEDPKDFEKAFRKITSFHAPEGDRRTAGGGWRACRRV
jgi:hypothetical protein